MADNSKHQIEFLSDPKEWMFIAEEGLWGLLADDKDDEADNIAEMLLLKSELPLVLRARVLMFLSAKDDGSSVFRAREALRIMEEDVVEECKDLGMRYPISHHKMALTTLRIAEQTLRKRLERRAATLPKSAVDNSDKDLEDDVSSQDMMETSSPSHDSLMQRPDATLNAGMAPAGDETADEAVLTKVNDAHLETVTKIITDPDLVQQAEALSLGDTGAHTTPMLSREVSKHDSVLEGMSFSDIHDVLPDTHALAGPATQRRRVHKLGYQIPTIKEGDNLDEDMQDAVHGAGSGDKGGDEII